MGIFRSINPNKAWGMLFLVIVVLFSGIYLDKRSEADVWEDKYLKEYELRFKLEQGIVYRDTEIKDLKVVLDSLLLNYGNSSKTDTIINNINNKYKDEKISVMFIPIDSTVSRLADWVSKEGKNR